MVCNVIYKCMVNIIYSLFGDVTNSFALKTISRKIGSTSNIVSRMKNYQTGYADYVIFSKIISKFFLIPFLK